MRGSAPLPGDPPCRAAGAAGARPPPPCASRGVPARHPTLPWPPAGPGCGSPRETSGSSEALRKEEDTAEKPKARGSAVPPTGTGRPGPTPPHAPAGMGGAGGPGASAQRPRWGQASPNSPARLPALKHHRQRQVFPRQRVHGGGPRVPPAARAPAPLCAALAAPLEFKRPQSLPPSLRRRR